MAFIDKKAAAKANIEPKGMFLSEVIEARNRWAGWADLAPTGSGEQAQCKEYVMAYERLIYAFTAPQQPTK